MSNAIVAILMACLYDSTFTLPFESANLSRFYHPKMNIQSTDLLNLSYQNFCMCSFFEFRLHIELRDHQFSSFQRLSSSTFYQQIFFLQSYRSLYIAILYPHY